jgi:hypothetical protein
VKKRNEMKLDLHLKYLCAVLFVCAPLTGCQTTAPKRQTDTRARFYESAAADTIMIFNRWDTIHITRPDTRESGFLPIYTKVDVERQLQNKRTGRGMAVVIFGFLFAPDLEAKFAREWETFLFAQGFQRVVVLRTGAGPIDGLLIAHDSGIRGKHDQAAVTATGSKIAALAPAVGADATDPSGR